MIRRNPLAATLFATCALGLIGAQSAPAEPLTPLTPNEIQYLEAARKVLNASHDPMAFRGDGRLLVEGRFACAKRATDMVGSSGTFVTPALTQLAFIYLCPE